MQRDMQDEKKFNHQVLDQLMYICLVLLLNVVHQMESYVQVYERRVTNIFYVDAMCKVFNRGYHDLKCDFFGMQCILDDVSIINSIIHEYHVDKPITFAVNCYGSGCNNMQSKVKNVIVVTTECDFSMQIVIIDSLPIGH